METRKKGSHLNIEERRQIAILDKEGWSPYAIGKKLKRASNTIRNELKRGTVKQMVGYQELEIYFPDTTVDYLQSNGIIKDGMYSRKHGHKSECTSWGDYFYLEALMRMKKSDWKIYW